MADLYSVIRYLYAFGGSGQSKCIPGEERTRKHGRGNYELLHLILSLE